MLWALGPTRLHVWHTFLYYVLTCTAHICLLYKGTHYLRNTTLLHSVFLTWYQSHYSNFSFSSPVSLGVTPLLSLLPSQQPLQPLTVETPTPFSRCPWVSGLQLSSLRSPTPHRPLHHHLCYASCSDKFFASTIVIDLPQSTQPWKSHTQQCFHAPSHATQRSNASVTRITHRPLFQLTSSMMSLPPCHLGLMSSSILC